MEKEINPRFLFDVLNKRKRLIFFVFILIISVAAAIDFATPRQYTASADILIDRDFANQAIEIMPDFREEKQFLDTQSAIIKSKNVVLRVVRKLNLTRGFHDSFYRNPKDHSFSSNVREFFTFPILALSHDSEQSVQNNHITDADTVAGILSSRLSVSPVRNTKIVSIKFTCANPQLAQVVTNSLVTAYKAELIDLQHAAADTSLHGEKPQEKESTFDKSSPAEETETSPLLQKFALSLAQTETIQKELESLQAEMKVSGNNPDQLRKIPEFTNAPILKALHETIQQTQRELKKQPEKNKKDTLQQKYTAQEFSALQHLYQLEARRIIDSANNLLILAQIQKQEIRNLLENSKGNFINSGDDVLRFSELLQKVERNRSLFNILLTNIYENTLNQSQRVHVWVIKSAEFPKSASIPKTRRILVSWGFLGLAAGITLAFILEFLDKTIKSESDIEEQSGK